MAKLKDDLYINNNLVWHKGNLANGTTAQYIRGDGSLATYSDTKYSALSAAEASTGTATTARTISAKVLADEINRRSDLRYLSLAGGTMTGNTVVNNYGIGNVGLYSATRYQNVFSMGAAYVPSADGTGLSNMYGIAWTHPNVGGQSKAGLSHQALFVEAGVTKTAIGTGIWTAGNVTASGFIGNASSATALTTNAGSATRPIYFSGGKPVQGTYTFGNANGNAPISNGVVNVNLNAAMLAGYTPSSFLLSRRMENPSDGTSEQGAIPFILALKAAGRPVYTDPEFSSGNGNVSVYDNGKQGSVSITRVSNTSAANSSGYVLEIATTSGVAGPGRGGFYQGISARANAVFCQIFRAKIPVGFSVNNAENSMGTGSTTHWLTDKAGTGKWEWYCRVTICGPTGTFSSGGYVYLVGSGAVTWQLAYCNVIDLSKGEYDGLRTRFADSADTASTATALTTNAGSATQPVYFSGGKPVAATAYASASVNYATSAGTATNATNTTNINTLADNSTNAARFILFSDAATGNQRAKTDTGLKYNPSTNTITATLAGEASWATTASSATYASAVKLTADNTTNATRYPLFASAATGNLSPRTDTGFTYNPSTETLTANTFAGNLKIGDWDLLTEANGARFTIKHEGANKMSISTAYGSGVVEFFSDLFIQDDITAGSIFSENDVRAYELIAYETVTAPTFIGALSGNATTATTADKLNITSTTSGSWIDMLGNIGDTVYNAASGKLRMHPYTGNILTQGKITSNGVDSSGVHAFSGSNGQWSSPGVILAFTKSLNNWAGTTQSFDQSWKIGNITFSALRSGRNITVYHYLGHTNYMAMGTINAGGAVITHVSSSNVACVLTIEGSYTNSHKVNIVIFGNNA